MPDEITTERKAQQDRLDLSDDQLETELHLLAVLLQRHKNLLGVYEGRIGHVVMDVSDFSPELHKSVHIHIRPAR